MEDPNAARAALLKDPEVLRRLEELMKHASLYFTDGKSSTAVNIVSK